VANSIVIFSNCQGEAIQNALKSILLGTDIPVHLVSSYKDFTKEQADQLSQCTVLIEQVQANERAPINDYVKQGTPRFRFPVMYTSALWPFSQSDRGFEPEGRPKLFGSPINDSQLAHFIDSGLSVDDALSQYSSLDYKKLTELELQFEKNRASILRLEQSADIALWADVERRFTLEPTFHCFYHPYASVMYPAAKEACRFAVEHVGADASVVDGVLNRWLENDAFDLHQAPVHPSVAEFFGLKWVKADTRYRLRYQGALKFSEFWRLYLTNEVDEGVERAAMCVDQDRGQAALRLLEEHPGTSPDRDVVKSQALLYADRAAEAKEISEGLIRENNPANYKRFVVDAWLRSAASVSDGRDCDLAVKIATEYPENAGILYYCGFILRKNGNLEDGARLLLRASELCPADTNYAYNAGLVYDSYGQYGLAIDAFSRAALYAPNESRSFYTEHASQYKSNNINRI